MNPHPRSKLRFFVFSHARVRPLTYREPMRFETDAFQDHPARMAKDGDTISGDRLTELDAFRMPWSCVIAGSRVRPATALAGC